MAEVIRMPRLSDTMEEGNIVEWHKQVGDEVEPGDVLAEVETDKATMEVESYQEGILLHIGVEKGPVPVNSVIAVIGEEGEDYQDALNEANNGDNASSSETDKESEDSQSPKEESKKPKEEQKNIEESKTSKLETNSTDDSSRIKASPLAKAMAKEKGIKLENLSGSGDGGRIIKADVESYKPDSAKSTNSIVSASEYEDVDVSQMRKTIARRLGESKFSAPHFYLTVKLDMDNAIAFRKQVNNQLEDVKISFNDIVVKACAMALKKHPEVNSSWLDTKIRYHKNINIGVAVAVEEGLLVPVLKNADKMSLSEINTVVKEKAGKARDKKLQPDEMDGNTFTISNLGMYGIDEFTAIINPPDACILAVGGIQKVPIVKNDEITIGNIMKVTLSCDHRVVDGAKGSEFLITLKSMLENPLTMLV